MTEDEIIEVEESIYQDMLLLSQYYGNGEEFIFLYNSKENEFELQEYGEDKKNIRKIIENYFECRGSEITIRDLQSAFEILIEYMGIDYKFDFFYLKNAFLNQDN